MMRFYAISTFLLLLISFGAVLRRARRRQVGPAAVGMIYDLLSQDRRNAVEMIVEEKAEERDSEHADGALKRKAAKKR